jgi:hypothetical protein
MRTSYQHLRSCHTVIRLKAGSQLLRHLARAAWDPTALGGWIAQARETMCLLFGAELPAWLLLQPPGQTVWVRKAGSASWRRGAGHY